MGAVEGQIADISDTDLAEYTEAFAKQKYRKITQLRRSYPPRSIIVKNLDASIDNQALYDTFSLFGNILSCKVECGIDGKSTGSGIVHFEEKDSAKQAIDSVNDMKIGENTVTVEQYTGDPSDEVRAWLR